MGAVVTEEAGDCLPLSIRGGNLSSIRYQSPVPSAQVKSAILLAGLAGNVPVTVVEPVRSRDHTERMFQFLGFDVQKDENEVIFRGAGADWPRVDDFVLEIPGDASSAAFLVAAALMATGGELLIEYTGVNPTRTGFLEVLARMGALVTRENERRVCGEPVADLIVRPSNLNATEVGADEIPGLIDEVPVLAVLAARAEGETIFRSVGELRVKESDRLTLIAQNLRAVGASAEVQGEDLVVVGSDRPFCGKVETARDHRLTMAFAVAGFAAARNIELSESNSAAISYPGFFQDLHRIMLRD
jgi:3-phosphoshikimate 1-carboxyvinyltransferase